MNVGAVADPGRSRDIVSDDQVLKADLSRRHAGVEGTGVIVAALYDGLRHFAGDGDLGLHFAVARQAHGVLVGDLDGTIIRGARAFDPDGVGGERRVAG